MFLPEELIRSTKELGRSTRRVLQCGLIGSGKTFTSLTTAPNPLLLAVSQGVSDPRLVDAGYPTIPFYDVEYCDKVLKSSVICNLVKSFVEKNITKFTPDQTLILDDLTFLQDSAQEFFWVMTLSESKENAGYRFFEKMRDYWVDLFKLFDRLPCNLIVNAHLTEVKKDQSFLHYHPMIEGSYKMRLGQTFTDVVRIIADSKTDLKTNTVKTEYKWQIKPTTDFPIAKSRSAIDKIYIPADFKELLKV